MITAVIAVIAGLALLVWSADRFVEGSAATACHLGMPPLLIGMVVVGFGTSAPEMLVSALSSYQGNPGIALGNAYGSNITNIALILGATALLSPIPVSAAVMRRELPILATVTALAAWQVRDGEITRQDAVVMLVVFAGLMAANIIRAMRSRAGDKVETPAVKVPNLPVRQAVAALIIGLALLILSSRILVWGAVAIAQRLGISDLIIGLTVVAVGTSLPELASSLAAARKGEHDIALGNVIGSNLFNTLAVVGIAGVISPMAAGPEVFSRDIVVMSALTVSLFALGFGFRGPGRIGRIGGAALLASYIAYNAWLVFSIFRP